VGRAFVLSTRSRRPPCERVVEAGLRLWGWRANEHHGHRRCASPRARALGRSERSFRSRSRSPSKHGASREPSAIIRMNKLTPRRGSDDPLERMSALKNAAARREGRWRLGLRGSPISTRRSSEPTAGVELENRAAGRGAGESPSRRRESESGPYRQVTARTGLLRALGEKSESGLIAPECRASKPAVRLMLQGALSNRVSFALDPAACEQHPSQPFFCRIDSTVLLAAPTAGGRRSEPRLSIPRFRSTHDARRGLRSEKKMAFRRSSAPHASTVPVTVDGPPTTESRSGCAGKGRRSRERDDNVARSARLDPSLARVVSVEATADEPRSTESARRFAGAAGRAADAASSSARLHGRSSAQRPLGKAPTRAVCRSPVKHPSLRRRRWHRCLSSMMFRADGATSTGSTKTRTEHSTCIDAVDPGNGPIVINAMNAIFRRTTRAPLFGSEDPKFDPKFDFLYADENGNGKTRSRSVAGSPRPRRATASSCS